jgi:hypothetical protein
MDDGGPQFPTSRGGGRCRAGPASSDGTYPKAPRICSQTSIRARLGLAAPRLLSAGGKRGCWPSIDIDIRKEDKLADRDDVMFYSLGAASGVGVLQGPLRFVPGAIEDHLLPSAGISPIADR